MLLPAPWVGQVVSGLVPSLKGVNGRKRATGSGTLEEER